MFGHHQTLLLPLQIGALLCGAKIDLIDIELENYNLDLDLLEKS